MDNIDISNPDAKSEDVVAENVRRLGELFPELLTEGPSGPSINVDVLKQLVGDASVSEIDEKYGLSWFGKRNARKMALTPSLGTLLPCPDESQNWDTTKNLMIEGDNLEVLKLLQKSYSGKVKLIYIDPPYNTGKDFVYPDNYQDNIKNYLELTGQTEEGRKTTSNTESSGRFHTDWLNMMYPRLRLAQTLLSEDGAIFISIDDGEVAHLREMTDEVFGATNFVANVIWQKKYTRANDAQWFSDNHDHILCYAKNKKALKFNLLPRDEAQLSAYMNPDNHPKGPWKATPLHAKSGSNTEAFTFERGVSWSPPTGTFRRFSNETMAKMDMEGEIWFGSDGKQTPSRKSFLGEVKDGVTPVTIWPYAEVGHNHESNSQLKALNLGGLFDNPKPSRLIQRMLTLASNSGSLVLDFFAGSGTTGHAVMEQNALDGGNRQFILVQLPERLLDENKEQALALAFCREHELEENIASLTAERLRRAGAKVRSENPMFAGDIGFRVFKLAESNIRAWDPLAEDLEGTLRTSEDHLVAGRSELDVLYEILLKRGLDLCIPIATKSIAGHHVSAVGGGVMFACLDSKISQADVEALAEGIVAWRAELGVVGDVNCIFRDSAFDGDVAKSNMSSILEQAGFTRIQSL